MGPAPSLRAVVGALGGYVLTAAGLYAAALGNSDLVIPSLLGLALLTVAFFLLAMFSGFSNRRNLFLALGILPGFTFVRLAFSGFTPRYAEPALSYVVLSVSLIGFLRAAHPRVYKIHATLGGLASNIWKAVPGGVVIAAAQLFLFAPSLSSEAGARGALALVAASVAMLDEYWFRGILQSQVESASTPRVGWIGTAVLYVAFGASSGVLALLVVRAGIGLVLGYVVMSRRQLTLALFVRGISAGLLTVLAPAALQSFLVA